MHLLFGVVVAGLPLGKPIELFRLEEIGVPPEVLFELQKVPLVCASRTPNIRAIMPAGRTIKIVCEGDRTTLQKRWFRDLKKIGWRSTPANLSGFNGALESESAWLAFSPLLPESGELRKSYLFWNVLREDPHFRSNPMRVKTPERTRGKLFSVVIVLKGQKEPGSLNSNRI